MDFLGSERGLTPNLDALANQSVVFSHAYAQVPLTTPSHAVILTGTYPQFNHVNYMGDALSEQLPFLPEILHRAGYKTAAFVGALVLEPKKLAMGFERGFDVYDAGFHRRRGSEDRYHSLERRAEDVVSHALAWINRRPVGPVFVWVHLYDPHDPYAPPEPYSKRYQSEPYDGEIAYTDAAVARLIAGFRLRNNLDNAVVAVMADHGEAFGEHGEQHHGIFLYDETIHVPLLIKLPGQRVAARVNTGVGLVDVAPTILEAVKLPVPAAMQGRSLLALSRSSPADVSEQAMHSNSRPPVYSESGYGHLSFGWSNLQAWRTDKYLYIEAPERELYDTFRDPLALHNLAPDSRAIVGTTGSQLADFYGKTAGGASANRHLDLEQSESLHALGYLSSEAAVASTQESERGIDPKDKIATANLLYRALVETEQEQFQNAVPILEEVIKEEPNTPIALLQLGRAYMALKEYAKAIAPLQTLVEKKPEDAFARYELGCALVKTGRWDEALPHFESAVSQMKSSTMMHFYLAMVYERTSRIPDALNEFQKSVGIDPNNFAANLLLGRLLFKERRAAAALPYLRKACQLRPDSMDAHGILSDAYGLLGREGDARRELEMAERIRAQGGSRLGTPSEQSDRNPHVP